MTPSLPAWVLKRDGRREPFDADKISQGLYAATEAIGAPNAFLARELTDSVLHFLGQESEGETVAATQIAELVEKVVRELGQPELARAFVHAVQVGAQKIGPAKPARRQASHTFFVDDSPAKVSAECLQTYSLQAVFSRDIAAAHANGLLALSGLETPHLLEAVVVDSPQTANASSPWSLGWSQARDAARCAERLILDSPELLLANHGHGWLEGFAAAAEAFGAWSIANVRTSSPPNWAKEMSAGPLFEKALLPGRGKDAGAPEFPCDPPIWDDFHVRWHLAANDFDDPAGSPMVKTNLAAQQQPRLSFILDRPRQPLLLSGGIDRLHPASLMRVGLNLRRFLKLPEVAGDAERMLAKLPSLVRMAASAGVQKRNYLRKHCPELTQGFLLDRARLLLEPFQLQEVVLQLSGACPEQSPLALKTACRILEAVRDAADAESRRTGMEMVVSESYGVFLTRDGVPQADATAQRDAAAALLKCLHDGCFVVFADKFSAETVWSYLTWAWRTVHISQIDFVRG